jgi:hypothetical protein
MPRSYDVHVRPIRTRKRADRKATSYEVRWQVDGREFNASYRLRAQATSAHADLVSASKRGDPFDTESGQPALAGLGTTPTVLTLAREIYAKEWAASAGSTRRALAENMAHACAVLTDARHPVDEARPSSGPPSGCARR